ncbi:unnamed protein product, partial [Ectocarpus sp. 12 AP-2014]
ANHYATLGSSRCTLLTLLVDLSDICITFRQLLSPPVQMKCRQRKRRPCLLAQGSELGRSSMMERGETATAAVDLSFRCMCAVPCSTLAPCTAVLLSCGPLDWRVAVYAQESPRLHCSALGGRCISEGSYVPRVMHVHLHV